MTDLAETSITKMPRTNAFYIQSPRLHNAPVLALRVFALPHISLHSEGP